MSPLSQIIIVVYETVSAGPFRQNLILFTYLIPDYFCTPFLLASVEKPSINIIKNEAFDRLFSFPLRRDVDSNQIKLTLQGANISPCQISY